MRIVIDGRMMLNSGIGRYIENLAANLPGIDAENSYHVLVNRSYAGSAPEAENLEILRAGREIPIYTLKEQLFLPFEVMRCKPDLIHYPSFNMPPFNLKPAVVTIHDLIYYTSRETCPNLMAHLYARVVFNTVARTAKKVITVSEYSRAEIVKRLGIRPDKVTVIYNGVGSIYRPVTDGKRLEEVRRRYGIKGDFVFYVGNHAPNKNLKRLIEAFSILKKRGGLELILGGKIDPRRKALYDMVREPGLKESVRFVGLVPEDDLPALYSAARLFVFPSLYEGFGLPPVEAMACGAPVVTSNATSLPEVAGDAAVIVDPNDAASIAAGMERALSSADLRAELKEKGLRRAKAFNWRDAAKRTLEVYREALR